MFINSLSESWPKMMSACFIVFITNKTVDSRQIDCIMSLQGYNITFALYCISMLLALNKDSIVR